MTAVFAWIRRLISGSGHIESKASVKVRRIHREGVEVAYQDSAQALTFKGELVGPRWKQVNIVVDRDARLDSRVLDNLAAELSRQKYQFVVYQRGETQSVPEPDRIAAVSELQQMGYAINVSADRQTVRQTRIPGVPPPSREVAKRQALRMMKLVETASGVRRTKEILAKSDTAII